MNAFKGGYLLEINKSTFDEYGQTYMINSFGTKVFKTIDPQVSKAVHTTYFSNFGLQWLRYDTATHSWGNGIIVVGGPHWKHVTAKSYKGFSEFTTSKRVHSESCALSQEISGYKPKSGQVLAEKGLNDRTAQDDPQKPARRLRLVDEMARDTQDKVTLRSQIISVFSPGHNGAATTLTNVIFHLALDLQIWKKLKEEVEPTRNELLSHELLNSYQYLEWVLEETHRLTTIATTNQRLFVNTTIVPFGGGPGLSIIHP
ncbi:hypothetical protein DM02DRAFT_657790 [Periconia macrospinosa]|uniref:Cytochrome P450 n=1 Tax=Periconia macrospinosa TaxID=97972 RepID=A0A2V1DLG5_9PLEO|nr:hypothetical protein DM02DRAFT_657790 [Periconia macrospinosa]